MRVTAAEARALGAKLGPAKRPKAKATAAGSRLEAEFDLIVRTLRLPPPEREHRFHQSRGWRFDRAWPAIKLAVECDGGTSFGRSRHSRGEGFEGDCEKLNAAALAGWLVLRFTLPMIRDGRAEKALRAAFVLP